MSRFEEFVAEEKHYVNEKITQNSLLPKEIHPRKTVKAYKLFVTKGGKLYPLFVKANEPIPINKWVEAEIGPMVQGGKVKSKIGALAFRPGWHSGNMPIATHIGGKSQGSSQKKPDYRPDDQVWAEIEVPADVNWQEEANKRAKKTKDGKIIPRTAQITDQVPKGGFYSYKTNPNMTGEWLISGAMKINRILSDNEVEAINRKFGVHDLPRLKDLQAQQVSEGKTPKQYVQQYLDNMFDNSDDKKYKSFEDMFDSARKSAYDWAGDEGEKNDFKDKISKVSISGFASDKKLFLKRK